MSITKLKAEHNALIFSFCIIILLMVCSLTFNELTESNILEVDAGSYVISAIISIVTIYISKLQAKPKDDNHPLGFAGFVPVLNLIRNFMLILICIKAIGESIGDLADGPPETDHTIMLLYAGITLFFNSIAYVYISQTGNKTNSALLKTDAIEWRTDIVFNFSIFLAVMISYGMQYTSYKAYSDHVDPIFCILFSVILCYSPIKMFSENVKLLSVSSVDKDLQQSITDTLNNQIEIMKNYNPKITAIHVAGVLWVNIELDFVKGYENNFESYKTIKNKAEMVLNEISAENKLSFIFHPIE
jgi:cation diffusion facilitator family transporter